MNGIGDLTLPPGALMEQMASTAMVNSYNDTELALFPDLVSRHVAAGNCGYFTQSWQSAPLRMDELETIVLGIDGSNLLATSLNMAGGEFLLSVYGDIHLVIVRLRSMQSFVSVTASTPCPIREKALFAPWERALPPVIQQEDESQVGVRFWYNTNNGPSNTQRVMKLPVWSEIDANYPSTSVPELERMMNLSPDESYGGKLLLWTGPPGTGKTYAIRSLIQEWRGWSRAEYITDPNLFLGDAEYMMNVLLSEPGEQVFNEATGDYVNPYEGFWKLIIMEDSGELIAVDAKEQVGQALSKLLNVTEGLLGQGMKVLLLITTNEEIGKLHPAVQRYGRCISNVKFSNLPKEQAQAWLAERGIEEHLTQSRSLADLFSLEAGNSLHELHPVLGFSGR